MIDSQVLPQEWSDSYIYHQAEAASLTEEQAQISFLTQTSDDQQRVMSGPTRPHDGAAPHETNCVETWKDLKLGNACSCDVSDFKQNLLCDCCSGCYLSVGTGQGTEGIESVKVAVPGGFPSGGQILKDSGAVEPQLQEESSCTADMVSSVTPVLHMYSENHLPESLTESEGCSLDLLRIVKHKPSAIVFCDHNHDSDSQATAANESSDGEESSSSSLKAEEGEDDFPETLQYKEFLVSRHRRNLSRNRKCLRRRQDFLCHGTASERPGNKDRPGFTGDLEEGDEQQNNGKQV